jgi:nitrilase
MRVSVMQMTPGDDKAENIAQASRLIAAAVDADRPDIVSLPEMWTCLGGSRTAKHEQAETLPAYGSNEPGGAAYEFLRGVARSQRITVHGGSLAVQHHRGLRPRRCRDRALPQDPHVRHRRPGRQGLP